jgi:glycine betaine/proline transport system permease protein
MNAVIPATRPSVPMPGRWALLWLGMIAVTVTLMLARESLPWAFAYPRAWQLPLAGWITAFMKWLINSFDLGLFTFKEFTRGLAWVVEQPYIIVKSFLSTGFLSGVGSDAVLVFRARLETGGAGWRLLWLPRGFRAMGQRHGDPELDHHRCADRRGRWHDPRYRRASFARLSRNTDAIIYAMPPMVRVTLLALEHISTEVVEAGSMAGCSRRQLLWKVLLPSAKRSLMVGVNQVVMLSLNMVIIASMIGAGGLGYDVLTALRRLKIGEGVEAGVAITLLAIALDRLSQAYANRPQPGHNLQQRGFVERHPHLLAFAGVVAFTWLLGIYLPAMNTYPESWQITTGAFWGDLVRYININFFDALESFKNFLLLNIMIPFKRFLLSLPWIAVVAMVGLGGWQLGGRRLGLLTASLTAFIAIVGLWSKAMVTLYLCGISVVIACLIGIPIGILAARNDRVHRVVSVVIDTLQTLPSFVYLMPVVMLFRVGDFAAMLAVIAYAVTPVIRYTDHGIRQVSAELIEASLQAGCTRNQLLRKVQIPLALPHIMLGVNQTIMMALSMLVITALVGTRELGQEVYIALTKADTGRGIIAGVCVAFIAIIADRMIGAWATKRKREYGLE